MLMPTFALEDSDIHSITLMLIKLSLLTATVPQSQFMKISLSALPEDVLTLQQEIPRLIYKELQLPSLFPHLLDNTHVLLTQFQ